MNYERGFRNPRTPPENGIGQNRDTWITETPMGGGGAECGKRPWTAASGRPFPVGNGAVGGNGLWNPVIPGNSFPQENDWNPNPFPQENGIVQSRRNSWTPVTPRKPFPQSRLENENWQDLVGVYQGLLREEALDLNEVAHDCHPHPPPPPPPPPPPTVLNGGNQNGFVRNLNPNPDPILNLTHNANEGSDLISYFRTQDPANWDCGLLATIVKPKRTAVCVLPFDGAKNNNVHASKGTLVQDSSTQVRSNSGTAIIDGFSAPYRPCYNLNSPPRPEPDGASSDVISPFPFARDNNGNHINAQWAPERANLSIEEALTPAKNAHENQRNEDADNLYNELLQTIGDSSLAVSTKRREHVLAEGIDLNKTPLQKTPPARRKKHRPKVVREGKKPKRTPYAKDPENGTPKRKYVRRKGVDGNVNVSETPENGAEEAPQSVGKRKYVRKKAVDVRRKNVPEKVTPPAKSCRKQLNFDLECVVIDESQDSRGGQQGINLNVDPQDIEQERRINSILERSAMKNAQKHTYLGVASHTENGNRDTPFPEQNVPTTPQAKARDHALNVLARNLSMRKSVQGQDSRRSEYDPVNQHLCATRRSLDERRGVKRQIFEQMHHRSANAMDSLLVYQKLLLGVDPRANDGSDLAGVFSETHKKTKTQSDIRPLEDNLSRNGVYENVSALQLLSSCTGRVNASYNGVGGNVGGRQLQPPLAARQNFPQHRTQPMSERPIAERSQRANRGQGVSSVTTMVKWNPPPPTPPKEASRSAFVQNSSNQRLNGADKVQENLHKDALESHQLSSTKAKGRARKPKFEVLVDDIIYKLESLCIYDENEKGRNALVPYRGDNAMTLFEPIKKRKPRPKVDLDPETDRLWRFLMGKEGNEGTETTDKDKEKWWEDERRVFRGRADSFIARMHLVQGDRRFSRWKGSVVDSVIGVFLTQNVSDHLSSSAFMSLAAKFPHKSKPATETCRQNRACVSVEEPIESMNFHENTIRPPVNHQKQKRVSEEEVNVSQDSLDSSMIQTVDEIRSSSGSNSETEDLTAAFETRMEPGPGPPRVNRTRAEKVSVFKELFNPECSMQIPRMGGYINLNNTPRLTAPGSNVHVAQEPVAWNTTTGSFCFDFLGGESISPLPSSNSGMTYQLNEPPLVGQYDFLSAQENCPPGPYIGSAHSQKGREFFTEKGTQTAQKQDSAVFGGISVTAEDRVSVVDKRNCPENTAVETNSKATQEPISGAGTNTSKARNGAADDERKSEFDWDSLRRQVPSNREKRERSKDAMDSLDYEALRRADVSEISDAIRERGMNNMLADRIKGFLDRLVKDHGSVDLEWLRDVPPDKAKDYLLSFRGLGLKSVECVRLLTLHHLAFPVDTNVGRIAVRLGWVPLQPLPESLQLHLLEMYPVLESIQKYIWPRLCKLDQLTLYELHYQMITFGKVFCTKSKPNCNACPMRAECRHFASAFASARLALPGPEEKRIVTSDVPIATNTTMVSRPMPLPPAENNYNKDGGHFGKECEPIIEEPTTPEPETEELSVSDIEDQYYDDSDEIPTIKLDMEEFTMNLQNIMQDNMDLQGDMSQALVALNPQVASIPTPKLKNVSRLRTEHQVYELPDSHQLLEGLDKREPDDPSPYLLAIWTPGETATSIQPPEEGCQAKESGKLCDQTTCFSCNSIKEANSQVVRGTILMPCRTAMRGSFPLNGTYFQVNEMFADHASSLNPIDVPRAWIWNLPRRTVYFGTSVSTIFKGLTTEEIQYCFWRGFVCVRGFDQKTRAPRPLMARLHFPASKLVKRRNEGK